MRFQIVYPKDIARLQRQGAVVIDLRPRAEYVRGHFGGAYNVPEPGAKELAMLLEPRTGYILYCDHGGRSMELARDLGSQGYRIGTVVGGWNKIRQVMRQ